MQTRGGNAIIPIFESQKFVLNHKNLAYDKIAFLKRTF